MKRKYDVVATIGKYVKDGVEKNRYLTVGAVLERDDGSLTMKLDSMPIVSEGWFNFYPPKQQSGQNETPQPVAAAPAPRTDTLNDEIPF